MTRKDFLQLIKLGIAGMAMNRIGINNSFAESVNNKQFKNWLWMHPWRGISDDEYKLRFEKIKSAGFDAIIPNVYAGHRTLYKSDHLPVSDELLEQFLPIAKSCGLEVHAWIWSMICNNGDIIEEHPDWFVVNRNGESAIDHPAYVGYYRFMCPNHPGVREFVAETVSELSEYPELDGIHLDYIRYPDVILPEKLQGKYDIVQDKEYAAYDYCYCSRCRTKFKEKTGIDILDTENPELNSEWRQFRYDSVTSMVNGHLIPPAKKSDKNVTAAVFPNWSNVRQEWPKWKVDAVFPMLYHGYYNEDIEWIKSKIMEGKQALNPEVKLYSGLFVDFFTPEELVDALDQSLSAGSDGIALFAYHSLDEEHWLKIKDWADQNLK
jgi:uncharacterized lipoprotein YddW (UPF0748 family)